MTADERIERLLNRFGQTIADLPKAKGSWHAYRQEHLDSAFFATMRWHGNRCLGTIMDCEDYICHLCDVIDRMETALDTATVALGCYACKHFEEHDFPKCEGDGCDHCCEIDDDYLIDENIEVEDEDG